MKKRVKEAEKEAIRRGDDETVNKEYFFTKKLFREILNEFKLKSLKLDEPNTELLELQKYLEDNRGDQSSIPNQEKTIQTAEIQTPPLGSTPMPNNNLFAKTPINTNLTATEQALLSPEEQVIARRT